MLLLTDSNSLTFPCFRLCKLSIIQDYLLCPGVHAVPEGHQHAVCRGPDGGRGRGALEPPQTDRAPSAAAGRGPAPPVSHRAALCKQLRHEDSHTLSKLNHNVLFFKTRKITQRTKRNRDEAF